MSSGRSLDKVSDSKGPMGDGGAWGREETVLGSTSVIVASRKSTHLLFWHGQHEYEARDD